MRKTLIEKVEREEARGEAKWGNVDRTPSILLNAAVEELGEVAHAINHQEGVDQISQEIAETIGVLSRLYDMVWDRYNEFLKTTNPIWELVKYSKREVKR